MLTVKIGAKPERELESAARAAGLTKSEFVRRGLHEAIARAKKRGKPTPWKVGHDLFGKVSNGRDDLSRTRARDLVAGRRNAKVVS